MTGLTGKKTGLRAQDPGDRPKESPEEGQTPTQGFQVERHWRSFSEKIYVSEKLSFSKQHFTVSIVRRKIPSGVNSSWSEYGDNKHVNPPFINFVLNLWGTLTRP